MTHVQYSKKQRMNNIMLIVALAFMPFAIGMREFFKSPKAPCSDNVLRNDTLRVLMHKQNTLDSLEYLDIESQRFGTSRTYNHKEAADTRMNHWVERRVIMHRLADLVPASTR